MWVWFVDLGCLCGVCILCGVVWFELWVLWHGVCFGGFVCGACFLFVGGYCVLLVLCALILE